MRNNPQATRARRTARAVLLVVAVAVAVFVLLGQLAAVLPVGWWSPVLSVLALQLPMLLLAVFRDTLGSWNIVLAALALAVGVLALRRCGGRRLPVAVTALSGTALLLALITTTVQIFSVHGATGDWFVFSPASPAKAAGRGPDRTVTYATLGGEPLKADLYLPTAKSAAPLVVSIHGGGFISGSRGPNPYTSWLADHGYAVLDVDYRLATATRHTWNTADADVGCALTWATAHASEYGLDMDRVATFGGSAGGNLAINVAYKANAGTLKPSCGTAAQLPKVKAAIGSYPVVDMTASVPDSAYGGQVADQYVGGSPARYPQRFRAVDAANQIGPEAPPTLILQGSRDHLVFADHTKAFADKLTAAGITHRYVELPFLEHAYDQSSVNIGTKATRALLLPWLQQYVGS
ncbi:alpha/beta hydrolase [Streptomyces sp. GbtcB6]|uniref:alpha/beta hydrolase n=1 Tax=Streptomyces sp. GbtcB6 TaxID=2824751 RepID=UPI001C300DB5|nr:alpha/beta hydrolase [Streptomyces sp. GbtcB6]